MKCGRDCVGKVLHIDFAGEGASGSLLRENDILSEPENVCQMLRGQENSRALWKTIHPQSLPFHAGREQSLQNEP